MDLPPLFWTLSLVALLLPSPSVGQAPRPSENSTATFYGGLSGAGTLEQAACGYGDLNKTGIKLMNAAASLAMWGDGSICGACFEVWCRESRWCRSGSRVTVTVTNLCPKGSEGDWCDPPRRHLDMAYPAWAKIATDPVAGWVKTYMRRVPCPRTGGIILRLSGNPWWTSLTVLNAAGSGDVVAIQVSTDRGATWKKFDRNWGAVWSLGGKLLGKALSFRFVTGLSNQTLTVIDGLPATWELGKEYSLSKNFPNIPFSTPSPSPPLPSRPLRLSPPTRPSGTGKSPPPKKGSSGVEGKHLPKLRAVRHRGHGGLHA